MPLNINKKNYRLADMKIEPDSGEPYPDPDESSLILEDRVDMASFGAVLHIREWQGDDGLVEQFALMLNITPEHPAYEQSKSLKGHTKNFEQVRRTDTWHSAIHSHQYFIDHDHDEREEHQVLYGGSQRDKSRRAVNGAFQKYYNELLYNPFQYIDRWEAGKP